MTTVIGILNITPDSFFDGGRNLSIESTLRHVQDMIDCGVRVIDVGAESTRPSAIRISQDEEWLRLKEVLPHIIDLVHSAGCLVSIDTRNHLTAEYAVALNIDIINDVDGLKDENMCHVVRDSGKYVIAVHSDNLAGDLINDMHIWAYTLIDRLSILGIAQEKIILDLGIGFNKTAEMSWDVVRNITEIMLPSIKYCVGHSRKSMFKLLGKDNPNDRMIETLGVSMFLINKQVEFIRVHDVKAHCELLKTLDACTRK